MALPAPGQNDGYTAALRTQSLGSTIASVNATQAVTTDVSVGGPEYAVILGSGGNISSWSITGPVDGQQIQLLIFKTVAASTIAWPTNFLWAANTAPVLNVSTAWSFIKMRYFSSGDKWREISRSLNVPN